MTRPEIWIDSAAVREMVVDAARWAPAETGGVLLGYWVDEAVVVVTAAIDAGPSSTHSEAGFYPDAEYQARRIADLYEASGRHHTYLGDWHTHPAGGIGLSRVDRRTMRRIGRSSDARCPRPLMAVLADALDWRLAIWCLRPALGRWLSPIAGEVCLFGR